MNATIILALLQMALKYGPAALAAFQTNEPLFKQFLADVQPALASPNIMTIIPLLTKWGPVIEQFIQTEGAAVQQFIKDVQAALAVAHPTAPVVVSTPPVVAMPVVFNS